MYIVALALVRPDSTHKAVQTTPIEKEASPQGCDLRFLPPHLGAWPLTGSKVGGGSWAKHPLPK